MKTKARAAHGTTHVKHLPARGQLQAQYMRQQWHYFRPDAGDYTDARESHEMPIMTKPMSGDDMRRYRLRDAIRCHYYNEPRRQRVAALGAENT